MLLPEFSQAEKIISCPRKIICNDFEQMKVLGNILNVGVNVEDHENYLFTSSFFKIAPTLIDDNTKNKLMNMQLGIRDPRER